MFLAAAIDALDAKPFFFDIPPVGEALAVALVILAAAIFVTVLLLVLHYHWYNLKEIHF